MRHPASFGIFSALFFLIAVPVPAAPGSFDVVERMGAASINWSEGYIDAEGVGQVPETVLDTPKAYVLALETAKANAFRHLFEAAKSVRVDSLTDLRDMIIQDEGFKSRIDALVSKSHVEDRVFSYSQRQVKVVLRMPLRGDLIRAVLSHFKRKVQTFEEGPVSLTTEEQAPAPVQLNGSPPSLPEKAAVSNPNPFTGLIIDARGIHPWPALLPRIIDESGREVYGPEQVENETAARLGLAGYCRGVSCQRAGNRAESRPLVVKALRTEGPGRSNILISNLDAEKLRAADFMSPFLSKAKVIISTD